MSTSHPLDRALTFIEGRHENKQEAIQALKNYIFQDLLGTDVSSVLPYKVLQSVMDESIKPIFRGDYEKQGLIEHLMTAVQESALDGPLDHFVEPLERLQQWIGEATEGQAVTSQARSSAYKLVTILRQQLVLPANSEKQSGRFLEFYETLSGSDFWKELGQLCQLLQVEGKNVRQSWDEERKTFLRIVGELAGQMEEMRQNTGGLGRHLGESIDRLRESQSLEDLQQLRILLVREAEDLKITTHKMHVRLTETRQNLVEVTGRLEEMETELHRARLESLTDALTGILNRRAFEKCLEREFARIHRHQSHLAVIMFDLDHFKKINDTYGHPAGDKVLINVSQRAAQTLRQEDVIARYGGEEFIVLLPDSNQEAASRAAQRMREAIAKLRFRIKTESIGVTASFGVSTFRPGMTPSELIKLADGALYKAKQSGRNRVVVAA